MKVKNNKIINYKLDDMTYQVHIDDLNEKDFKTNGGSRILNRKQRKICKEQDNFKPSKALKNFFDKHNAEVIEADDELLNELLEFDGQNYEE